MVGGLVRENTEWRDKVASGLRKLADEVDEGRLKVIDWNVTTDSVVVGRPRVIVSIVGLRDSTDPF